MAHTTKRRRLSATLASDIGNVRGEWKVFARKQDAERAAHDLRTAGFRDVIVVVVDGGYQPQLRHGASAQQQLIDALQTIAPLAQRLDMTVRQQATDAAALLAAAKRAVNVMREVQHG